MCLGSRGQAGGSSFYHSSLIVIRARVSRRRPLFASPGRFGGRGGQDVPSARALRLPALDVCVSHVTGLHGVFNNRAAIGLMRPLPKFPLPTYGELMPRLPAICCCVVAGKLNVLACLLACMHDDIHAHVRVQTKAQNTDILPLPLSVVPPVSKSSSPGPALPGEFP